MIFIVSFVSKVGGWLNEGVCVERSAVRVRIGKDPCILVMIIRHPLEGTELLVQKLPRLNFGEEVEENDPEDDLLGLLRSLFNDLFNKKLTALVQDSKRVAEKILLQNLVARPSGIRQTAG